MSKRYRLKKDLKNIGKAGTVVVWSLPSQLEYANLFGLLDKWPEIFNDYFEEIKEEPKEVFTWDGNYESFIKDMDNLTARFKVISEQWKQLKSPLKPDSKERIEVSDVRVLGNSDHGHWYEFHVAGTGQNYLYDIPTDKLPLIQQAIEAAINSEYQVHPDGSWSIHSRNEKLYTQQDIDKAREQTWVAAKDTIPDPSGLFQLVYKYPTLQSYLNTLK